MLYIHLNPFCIQTTMVLKKRQTGCITLALAGILVLGLVATGCVGNEPTSSSSQERTSIKVTGSTTILPIAQLAADAYMGTHSDADIQVTGGAPVSGSRQQGRKLLISGCPHVMSSQMN